MAKTDQNCIGIKETIGQLTTPGRAIFSIVTKVIDCRGNRISPMVKQAACIDSEIDQTEQPEIATIEQEPNATWSWLFFGLHRIDLALLNIGMQLVAVAVTAILFSSCSIAGGLLLVPYLAWVAFAAALNVGFWQLNG